MANEVKTYTLQIGNVYNGGEICKNASVVPANSTCVAVNCTDPDNGIYTVQIGPECNESGCISFLVTCEDCGTCPPQIITKCFCQNIDDCGDCETCGADGFCHSYCPDGFCENGSCAECNEQNPCPNNLVCENGECRCPAGTTLNSSTGMCDECSANSDCEECEQCLQINGVRTCVPVECTTGVCDPDTDDCVECNNSTDCGHNERCTGNHECECLPGFTRINGICTYTPCQFDTDCGPCEYCDPENGCQPTDCGTGVCNPATGNCEEPCNGGECPPGSGCLEGFCVPCDQLSCSGVISQCSQAQGCDCNGAKCEYVDCTTSDCVDWVITPPTVVPGTPVPGSGTPAPAFTVTFTQLGIVPMSGGSGSFLDYSITITETGGNSGAWSVEGTPLGTGTSITFTLSQVTNVQWNNVGFEVNFVGNAGQSGSIVIVNNNYFNIDPVGANESFFADLMTTPANWSYDVQGSSVPPTSNGGSFTPGSMKLCPCGDADIIAYNWTTIEGNLTMSFTPLNDGCVRVIPQGCGVGEGTVTIDCAGVQTTLPIPSLPYDFSSSNCCDPLTEEGCTGTPGDGFGCTTFTPVQGDIVLTNTNFVTTDGHGLFMAVIQPDSFGYSIAQWVRVARAVCWNVTGTVREATTFIPPSLQHLFHYVEYRNGEGCVQFGQNCEVRLPGCKIAQAEACFSGCNEFDVTINGESPSFTASVSTGNAAQVSYAWSTNNGLTGTGSSFNLPVPNTAVTSVTVVATLNVNGTTCIASDTVAITLDAVLGCTNPTSCNYNEEATVDDGRCFDAGEPSYSCASGFVPPQTTVFDEDNPVVSYTITGGSYNGTAIVPGQSLIPGNNYTIGIRLDGIETCTRTGFNVPVCYTCDGENCVTASTLNNKGFATSDCEGRCSCSITITPYFLRNGAGALAKIYVNATGGAGLQLVSITKVGGSNVMFANGSFAGGQPAVSSDVCDGNYTITVQDNFCQTTETIAVSGYNCESSTLEFLPDTRCIALGLGNGPCYDCTTNQAFYTFAGDQCSTSYERKLTNLAGNIAYGSVVNSPTTGQGAVPTGIPLADGVYKITITGNGDTPCAIETQVAVACSGAGECSIDYGTPATASYNIVGSDLTITAQFTATAAGELYTIQLIEMVGGNPNTCTGGSNGPVIQTVQQTSVIGANQSVFSSLTLPVTTTCYKVVTTKNTDPSCTTTAFVSVNPFAIPGVCGGTITSPTGVGDLIYDEPTEMVYVTWVFSGTSGNMTVKIYVSPDGTCDINADPLVVNQSGLGQTGSGMFGPIPQVQGQEQCITIVVHDTNDVDCSDTVESEIAACTCGVEILNTTVDSEAETMLVEYRTKCTSGDVDFTLSSVPPGISGSSTDNAASTDGQWVNNDISIAITGYPTTGGDVNLEMADNLDVACIDTLNNINLPGNCVSCAQVVGLSFGDAVVTEVRDENNNNLLSAGPYSLSNPGDRTSLQSDLQMGILGQNAIVCSSPSVSVQRNGITYAGAQSNQSSTDFIVLDHAKVTHASRWAGAKKVYFGDCGCGTGRVCDYVATLDLSTIYVAPGDQAYLYFYYGAGNISYYEKLIAFDMLTEGEFATALVSLETQIMTALTTLAGCESTVADVSVAYDTGTNILTITILGTNAPLGLVSVGQVEGITLPYVDFTQSNCV